MAGRALTRKSKAITLVPLALASAAWTASIVTVGGASAAQHHDGSLPGGAAVPDKQIQAPASVPVDGLIAPAVPNGATDQVVASASTSGIPSAAISAYQRGAQIMDAADTTCNIPWELIAAIGRVESNHGTYGGNVLTDQGISKPGIYGPRLDGTHGTQEIADTDGGELDKDAKFDRAVGPMQFIPSTWSAVKVDADGDGQRNPQDINDAALATAVYLCSGKENLATRAGQESAVFRYNHSKPYVDLVLRIMEAYQAGDYSAMPSGTYGGSIFSPDYTSAIDQQVKKNKASKPKPAKAGGTTAAAPTGTGSGSTNTGTGSTPSSPTTSAPGGTSTSPSGASTPVTQAIQQTTTTVKDITSNVVPQATTTPVTTTVNGLLGNLTPALGKVQCNLQFGLQPDKLKACLASYGF